MSKFTKFIKLRWINRPYKYKFSIKHEIKIRNFVFGYSIMPMLSRLCRVLNSAAIIFCY